MGFSAFIKKKKYSHKPQNLTHDKAKNIKKFGSQKSITLKCIIFA